MARVALRALHRRLIQLDAGKFHHYLGEEEAWAVIAAREQAGQGGEPGREVYAKYAKAIVRSGGNDDETYRKATGQRLEIIPLANPCDTFAALSRTDHLNRKVKRNEQPDTVRRQH